MSAEQEFDASLELMIELETELSVKALTLDKQASLLEQDDDLNVASDDDVVGRVAKFCLLSEICGALDFDRMVAARERFQDAYPEHFSYYLANLENIGWQITWPGCLECAHFSGACVLGAMPLETPDSRTHFDKYCELKMPRQSR